METELNFEMNPITNNYKDLKQFFKRKSSQKVEGNEKFNGPSKLMFEEDNNSNTL